MGGFLKWLFTSAVVSILVASSNAAIDSSTAGTQCLQDRRNDLLTVRLVIDTTNDPINVVFGCREYPNGTFALFDCQATREGGNFLVVEAQVSTLAGQQGTVPEGINGCGVTAAVVNNDWEYSFTFLLRNEPFLRQAFDADIKVTCRQSQATQQFVVNLIPVANLPPIVLDPATPDLRLQVYALDEGTQTFSLATQCVVGQDLQLRLTMTLSQYIEFLSPCGLTIVDLLFSKRNNFVDSNQITTADSCPVSPNILALGQSFTRTFSNGTQVVYSSGTFDCVPFRKREAGVPDEMWFSVSVDFCFGTSDCDSRCSDFCAYNRALGRRKREANQTGSSVDHVPRNYRAMVTVIDRESNENTGQLSDIAIVGVTVAAALVVIATMIILAVVYLRRNRRQIRKHYDSNSSMASSRHVLPVKY